MKFILMALALAAGMTAAGASAAQDMQAFVAKATAVRLTDLQAAADQFAILKDVATSEERAEIALNLGHRLLAEGDKAGALSLAKAAALISQDYGSDNRLATARTLTLAAELAAASGGGAEALAWAQAAAGFEKVELGVLNPGRLSTLELVARLASAEDETLIAKAATDDVAKIKAGASNWGVLSSTMGPDGAAAATANFDLRTIFYATTRTPGDLQTPAKAFGAVRGQDISYGRLVVSTPRAPALAADTPRPLLLRLEWRPGRDQRPVLTKITSLSTHAQFQQALRDEVTGSRRKEALLVVHGYRQTFEDAALLTARVAADLEVDGAAVMFSWPSQGELLGYMRDVDEAESTANADALASVIRDTAAGSGAASVYVVAHSMGNRVLLKALDKLQAQIPAADLPLIDELVFASPDVFVPDFTYVAPRVRSLSHRGTLYASTKDQALKVSGWFRSDPRAGDAHELISLPSAVETIDTSSVSAGGIGHDDFRAGARDDFRAVVWGRVPAARRCHLAAGQAQGTWSISSGKCDTIAFRIAVLFLRRWERPDEAVAALGRAAEATDVATAEGASLRNAYLAAASLVAGMKP